MANTGKKVLSEMMYFQSIFIIIYYFEQQKIQSLLKDTLLNVSKPNSFQHKKLLNSDYIQHKILANSKFVTKLGENKNT